MPLHCAQDGVMSRVSGVEECLESEVWTQDRSTMWTIKRAQGGDRRDIKEKSKSSVHLPGQRKKSMVESVGELHPIQYKQQGRNMKTGEKSAEGFLERCLEGQERCIQADLKVERLALAGRSEEKVTGATGVPHMVTMSAEVPELPRYGSHACCGVARIGIRRFNSVSWRPL